MLSPDAHESPHGHADGRQLRRGPRTRLAAVLAAALLRLLTGSLGAGDNVGLSVLLEARVAVQRGLNLLLTHQRADGSWAGDPSATAQVLICLENAPDPAGEAQRTAATTPAVAYLRRTVAEACASGSVDGATPGAPGALAAALMALARDHTSTHGALLAQGRARLLELARPLDLPDGTRGIAFGARLEDPPEPGTTCAALDGLLATAGLEPAWTRDGYGGLTAYLRSSLRSLPDSAPAAVPGAAVTEAPGVGPANPALTAALLRALLCLGASPAEPPVASALGRLARSPPAEAAAAFALAEALSLARPEVGTAAAAPLAGWRDRLIEALLGAQQGDGGWPAAAGQSRDGATALALRALQVAAGRHLADTEAAAP